MRTLPSPSTLASARTAISRVDRTLARRGARHRRARRRGRSRRRSVAAPVARGVARRGAGVRRLRVRGHTRTAMVPGRRDRVGRVRAEPVFRVGRPDRHPRPDAFLVARGPGRCSCAPVTASVVTSVAAGCSVSGSPRWFLVVPGVRPRRGRRRLRRRLGAPGGHVQPRVVRAVRGQEGRGPRVCSRRGGPRSSPPSWARR